MKHQYLPSVLLAATLLLAGGPTNISLAQSYRPASAPTKPLGSSKTPGQCDSPQKTKAPVAAKGVGPFTSYPTAPKFTELSFYVVAHQDDWQLFMGNNAFNDISNFREDGEVLYGSTLYSGDNTGGKVVFLYLTAGASANTVYGIDPHTPTPNPSPYINRTVEYWQVREAGAINSVQLAANRNGAPRNCFEPYPDDLMVSRNGHSMRRYEYKNTVSYFLRVDPVDFATMAYYGSNAPGFQMHSVDGLATYNDWCDLTSTIGAIYTAEMATTEPGVTPWLNIPDSNDQALGGQNYDYVPGHVDHDAHIITGRAAVQAAKGISVNMPTALYIGYPSSDLPDNLGFPDTQNEAGLVAVYCQALIDYRMWAEWQDTQGTSTYQKWAASSYYRVSNTNSITTKYCYQFSNPGDWGRSTAANQGSATNLALFPNPASKQFSVKAESNSTLLEVRLRDMTGKEIRYLDGNQKSELAVDLTNIASGMYNAWIVQVDATGKKTTTIRKVLIESKL